MPHKSTSIDSLQSHSTTLTSSQIEFVFQSIVNLLQSTDNELTNDFITIKNAIEKQDNTTLISSRQTRFHKPYNSLSKKDMKILKYLRL